MRRTRVLIAHHVESTRRDLCAALSGAEHVEIVGEAEDGAAAVHLAAEHKTDVVVMGQDMPRSDGIEAARRLKDARPHVEIIIVTDRLDETKAWQAAQAGAMGYVLRDIPPSYLSAAVQAVCNGRAFFHPEITRKLMERLRRVSLEQPAGTHNGTPELTPRQFDILVEIAKGSTYTEIANKFVVTEGTIKTHIHNILRRLDCHNRTQLVAYALRTGLIK